eukprot:jgi/Mesen1/5817/ME000296S05106
MMDSADEATDYEKQRAARIARNNAVLNALALPLAASELATSVAGKEKINKPFKDAHQGISTRRSQRLENTGSRKSLADWSSDSDDSENGKGAESSDEDVNVDRASRPSKDANQEEDDYEPADDMTGSEEEEGDEAEEDEEEEEDEAGGGGGGGKRQTGEQTVRDTFSMNKRGFKRGGPHSYSRSRKGSGQIGSGPTRGKNPAASSDAGNRSSSSSRRGRGDAAPAGTLSEEQAMLVAAIAGSSGAGLDPNPNPNPEEEDEDMLLQQALALSMAPGGSVPAGHTLASPGVPARHGPTPRGMTEQQHHLGKGKQPQSLVETPDQRQLAARPVGSTKGKARSTSGAKKRRKAGAGPLQELAPAEVDALFHLFDERRRGRVTAADVRRVAEAHDCCFSPDELQDMVALFGASSSTSSGDTCVRAAWPLPLPPPPPTLACL